MEISLLYHITVSIMSISSADIVCVMGLNLILAQIVDSHHSSTEICVCLVLHLWKIVSSSYILRYSAVTSF